MSKRILLVDDEAELVELVKIRLEKSGYEVITAPDGDQGLKKARAEKPDLILLDIMMPEKDGYTFIKEKEVDPEISKIPVIILTSKDEMQDLFEMEGVKDYVVKLEMDEKLIETVKKYV